MIVIRVVAVLDQKSILLVITSYLLFTKIYIDDDQGNVGSQCILFEREMRKRVFKKINHNGVLNKPWGQKILYVWICIFVHNFKHEQEKIETGVKVAYYSFYYCYLHMLHFLSSISSLLSLSVTCESTRCISRDDYWNTQVWMNIFFIYLFIFLCRVIYVCGA